MDRQSAQPTPIGCASKCAHQHRKGYDIMPKNKTLPGIVLINILYDRGLYTPRSQLFHLEHETTGYRFIHPIAYLQAITILRDLVQI